MTAHAETAALPARHGALPGPRPVEPPPLLFPFRPQRWLLGAAVVLFGALTVQLLARGGAATWVDQIFSRGVYNAIPLVTGACCLLHRPGARLERRAWTLMGLGVLAWGAGDIYWEVAFAGMPETSIPYPSLADLGYLAFYPPMLVGLALLVRSQLVHFARSLWLDAVIAALTMAAVTCAFVFDTVLASTSGSAETVATNLAYPIGDVLLLALAVGFLTLAGRRLTGAWVLIVGALALFAASDSIYLVRVANGTYTYGSALDVTWLLAMVGLAAASARGTTPLPPDRLDADAVLPAIPVGFALVNVAIDAWDHFHPVNRLGLALSVAGLLVIVIRMALSMAENRRLLRASRWEALTDPLTGLPNRRRLMGDLDAALRPHHPPMLLMLFDLDGFKRYNDTFGHIAGDRLLTRLAERLARVAQTTGGTAYRLGGDEFCLLAPGRPRLEPARVRSAALRALSEDGEAFAVRASCGEVRLHEEARETTVALRLADQRMYAEKGARPEAGRRSMGVLLSALQERDPELADHTGEVTTLAVAVARSFGLPADEVERVRLAAQLHDIGKIAIPDAILNKPAPLSATEREFMSRHTIIGERITAADPALHAASELIRSSHERWDGGGYPDGLRSTGIPLGSRIVFACDAYDAMTTNRPYKRAIGDAEALAELRRGAGSQFDPEVVEHLVRAVAARKTDASERERAA